MLVSWLAVASKTEGAEVQINYCHPQFPTLDFGIQDFEEPLKSGL